jgi:hypothetical protein
MEHLSDDDIKKRLEELEREFASAKLIRKLYGIELGEAESLIDRIEAWADRHYSHEAPVFDGEQVHRWRLETFLQDEKLLPVKWAGARLGMSEDSFRELARQLVGEHLLDWEPERQVIRKDDVEGIRDNFETLRHQVFDSHQRFCSHLHDAIENAFGLEIDALHCRTSEFLGEEPTLYARGFDSLTYEPVSTRYEHWLQIGKPMHLRPDVCSSLTLVAHEHLLEDYLFPGEQTESADPVRDEFSSGRMRT